MTESIIILGPKGCGKTLNAAALAKAYGFKKWCDAGHHRMPRRGYLILAYSVPADCPLRVVEFREAMKKVPNPHPKTPKFAI
jgi:hypothetical protein